jgi:transcriptional regulator with XRE-family HTH domain
LRRPTEAAGYKQEVFVEIVGINRTYISDIERGGSKPTVEVAYRVAKAFGVNAGALRLTNPG